MMKGFLKGVGITQDLREKKMKLSTHFIAKLFLMKDFAVKSF